MKTEILYEDDQILVAGKPAGLPTQTANTLQPDVVSELKLYLSQNIEKQKKQIKEPYLAVIHRLDQPVSGVLVFAKTPSAAAALTKQLSVNKMQKEYLAVVLYHGTDTTASANNTEKAEKKDKTTASVTLVDYLLKDGKTNTSGVVEKETPHAKRAELTYGILKIVDYESASAALLRVVLKTGRHHQIRVQLAHAGMPLLGDQKYGTEESRNLSSRLLIKDVALCADKLSFYHPQSKKRMSFQYQTDIAKLPTDLPETK